MMKSTFSPAAFNTGSRVQTLSCTLLASLGLLLAAPALANVEITTAGPVTRIGLTPDGNFYANYTSFNAGLFYGNTAAVWAVYDADNNVRYAPANIPAGTQAQGTAWTPVSQQPVSGSGTAVDPYKISSTMKSSNGLEATITVTYVTGQDSWSNSYSIRDTRGADRNLRVFMAADLYFNNSDVGQAVYDQATGGVGGISSNVIANFRGLFIPVTPASAYVAANYSTVWNQVSANQLTNLIQSGSFDNGAGLQWNVVVPANGEKTIDSTNLFSNAAIIVSPSTLPEGTVGTAYDQTFSIGGGGTAPYTMSIASGSLPPGMTFDPATQTISGTPTTAGSYPFTIQVTDHSPTPQTRSIEYAITVIPPGPYTHADVTTRTENNVVLTTINGQLVPYPEHVGQNTHTFVFANLAGTDTWWLLNPVTGWHLWADCNSSAFSYSSGPMPWDTEIAVFYDADLASLNLQGSPVFFGYGVGDDATTACTDMLNNTRIAHVATM